MASLESIGKDNWEEFLSSGAAVLLVGKSDCGACQQWARELGEFLEQDQEWGDVRFGKVMLDTPGLVGFKRASPWLTELESLPYTAIYVDGERQAGFVGGGVDRLQNRLRRLLRDGG